VRVLISREAVKSMLGRSSLAYKAAEIVYENSLYVPHIARQGLGGSLLGPRQEHVGAERQSVLTWNVPLAPWGDAADLVRELRSRGIQAHEGGHAVYVAPQPALDRLIPSIVGFYPERCGFKILKDCRDPQHARYLYKHRRWLRLLRWLIGTPHDQLAPANYMWSLGIGPRVWDLTCWTSNGARCSVFVVEHVEGGSPTLSEYQLFLDRLRELNGTTRLRILIPHWESNPDFAAPDCNRNLVRSEALGGLQYVDFQNFGLTRAAARPDRSPDPMRTLVRERRIRVDGRPVLEIGCRTGSTIAAALSSGATWAVGWAAGDAHALEQSLLLSGATRFSSLAGAASPADLERAYPAPLRRQRENAVVFWRRDGGTLVPFDVVQQMPWTVLVREAEDGRSPLTVIRRDDA
jgi:hypothetical protein